MKIFLSTWTDTIFESQGEKLQYFEVHDYLFCVSIIPYTRRNLCQRRECRFNIGRVRDLNYYSTFSLEK